MRTIRGIQITSILVLSPVLLLLISLICMLCISIFKQIVTTPADILIQQQQRSFNNKQTKRFRFFTKMRKSPMACCVVFILYALYVLLKKQKTQAIEPLMIEPMPKANKKHSKRRKMTRKEKKKRLDHVNTTTVTPKVNTQQQQQLPTPSCTTPIFDNSKIDLNLISPESTPVHSEDETEEISSNWYSPFITGLDLDIIPKLQQDPIYNSPIFTTNHYKTTIPTHQQEPSRIKLLEIHPFIPSPSIIHHTHHAFGSIGDKRKNINFNKNAPKLK